MFKLLNQFKSASFETKQFILTCMVLILLLIVTLVYSFARLNFDRSDQVTVKEKMHHEY